MARYQTVFNMLISCNETYQSFASAVVFEADPSSNVVLVPSSGRFRAGAPVLQQVGTGQRTADRQTVETEDNHQQHDTPLKKQSQRARRLLFLNGVASFQFPVALLLPGQFRLFIVAQPVDVK